MGDQTYIDTRWIGGVITEASGEFGQKEAGADRDQEKQRQAADVVRRFGLVNGGHSWLAGDRGGHFHDGTQ